MKERFLIICIFSIFIVKTFGQKNGQILSIEKVEFLPYEKVESLSDYCDKGTYEAAIRDQGISFERITYFSDSLKVIAYYSRPVNSSGKKLPVIVFNRGSYIRNDIAYVHAPLFKTFVDSGFVVIAPALRGSEGGEGIDENGGKDVNDLMHILPLLDQLNSADVASIFMYGESRGGYMTFLAAKNGFPIKAAATVGAITDMELYVKDNPSIEPVCHRIWPNFKEDRKQIFEERSVMYWADKINVPVLIMNGNKDPLVNPIHSLNLAAKFQDLGKTYQLLIIDGGDHRLSGFFSKERDESIIRWFKKYL